MRFSETGPQPGAGAAWVEAEREALAAHGLCRLAVTLRETGAVVGYCGLRRDPTHPAARQGALALRLGTPRRGRGYGREAAGAALVHGFLALGLVRVVARLEARNAPAIRAVETVGLRLEGLEIRPGDGRPRQLYALERPL
jgi:RimJ/RimL family protein N-acetyltransferase